MRKISQLIVALSVLAGDIAAKAANKTPKSIAVRPETIGEARSVLYQIGEPLTIMQISPLAVYLVVGGALNLWGEKNYWYLMLFLALWQLLAIIAFPRMLLIS